MLKSSRFILFLKLLSDSLFVELERDFQIFIER